MFSQMNYLLLNRLLRLLSLIFGVRSGASCRMRWLANLQNTSAHTAHSLACGKRRDFRPSSQLFVCAPAIFNRMTPLTRKRSSTL
ncbi:hypothetical protein BDZ88DRAFT_433636 [Geranomyces variabilis]|nr:hypothetical protein BDZ88DRAFT_433636 [Geranomyces variabilis]